MTNADETIERGSNDLDGSDLTVVRSHARFLERKHDGKEHEVAAAAAFTDTGSTRTLIERLNVAITFNALGVRVDSKRASLIAKVVSGIRRVAARGLRTDEFSPEYVLQAAARETGVPQPFVDSLKADVRERLIQVAQ